MVCERKREGWGWDAAESVWNLLGFDILSGHLSSEKIKLSTINETFVRELDTFSFEICFDKSNGTMAGAVARQHGTSQSDRDSESPLIL